MDSRKCQTATASPAEPGGLSFWARRKNTSLGNLDFADKRVRYFEDRVESLPNSQRLLVMTAFALSDLESRQKDLLDRLRTSYAVEP